MSSAVLEGRTLGEFTLRDKIGEGGFATVHRAYQTTLEREAVVKVLHARLAKRGDVIQRFLRESKLASRLDHPFAAHVYAFGAEPDGTLWIAMELVRGTPMDKLLEQSGALSLDRFVPLFERICEVVQTAHERGIVHRDLKPANVMVLSRAGRLLPKLLDFGIARVVEETRRDAPGDDANGAAADDGRATRAGAVMGSPRYMAPEQWADAASVGQAADIYALGIIVFEALTGRPPFEATTIHDAMTAHATGKVPPLGPGLEALDPVVARALAKRAEDRYATAGDLAAAVRVAAGRGEAEVLPELEEPLRVAMSAGAPQPLAEAVAALEAARNVDQACAQVADVVAVVASWIGTLALAARTKVGSGGRAEAADAVERLRALGRGSLDDAGWIELARALTRPFYRRRDAYPIPELVGLLHGEADLAATPAEDAPASPPFLDAFHRLGTLRGQLDRRAGKSDEQRRDTYGAALAALADLLRPLRFLLDYTVIVTRRSAAERWRGLRRSPRPRVVRRARPLPEGEPYLLDAEGQPTLALAPLVQVAAPAPGKDEELFTFAGRGQHGPRLVAMPHGFELHDAALDTWLRAHLFDLAGEDAAAPEEEASPYRGLAAFTAADSRFYFGREREVETVVNRLRVEAFLAIVGPSGAGKSSFVQAGLLTRLPTGWRTIVVRPGPSPMATLEARLERSGVDASGTKRRPPGVDRAEDPPSRSPSDPDGDSLGERSDRAEDPADDSLGERLRAAAAREGTTIVLVVDQFEELFTLCRDAGERSRYAEAIAGAARSDDDPVRVVITLRDDFLMRAEAEGPLRERLAQGMKLLTTPGPEDLERILLVPAQRVGYQFEERALAAEMVAAVAGQQGALALLSFTAAELWKLRDRHFHQLSRKAYTALGGVAGALARHAEDTLAEMSTDEQRLSREAFRHLVTAEGTRSVLQLAELRQLLQGTRGDAVIERLVAARLLVVSEEAGGEDRVEVIHEALLEAWPRLVAWRREDSEGARLRDQLRTAARQWDSRGRPRGLLWRDEALAEYQIWRGRYPGALTDVEVAFADASVDDALRGRRVRRGLLVVTFAILAIGLTVMFQLRGHAVEQRAIVRAQLLKSYEERGAQELLAGRADEAFVYLAEALEMGADQPPVRYMLQRALEPLAAEVATMHGHTAAIWAVEFTADGKRVLTAAADGTARIWDVGGNQLAVLAGHSEGELALARSRDDRWIATADSAGVVRLWSGDGTPRPAFGATGTRVAFTPDGSLVAAGSEIQVWDVAGNKLRARWATETVTYLEVSASGNILTVGSGVPTVWASDGSNPRRLEGHRKRVWYAHFDPAGRRVVTASIDETARIWDADTGAELHVLGGHEGRVTDARFDRTGRHVMTVGADGTARWWNVEGGAHVRTLRGHAAQLNAVAFAEEKVVTVAADGTARMWDTADGVQVAMYLHAPSSPTNISRMVFDAKIGPGDRLLATASWSGTVKLWDLSKQVRLARDRSAAELGPVVRTGVAVGDALLAVHARGAVRRRGDDAVVLRVPATVTAGSLRGDGLVVLGDEHGVIYTFAPDSVEPRRFGALGGPVRYLEFDHTGQRVAAVWRDELAVFDVDTGVRRTFALPDKAREDESRVAFAKDGRIVLLRGSTIRIASADLGPLRELEGNPQIDNFELSPHGPDLVQLSPGAAVWSLDGRRRLQLDHPNTLVAAWTPRGELAITGSADGSVSIWSTSDWSLVERIGAHGLYVSALAVTDDTIATSGGDRLLHVWSLGRKAGDSRRLFSHRIDAPAYLAHFTHDRLVTASPQTMEVWSSAPYAGTRAGLEQFLCRLPVRLEGGRLVPTTPTCR